MSKIEMPKICDLRFICFILLFYFEIHIIDFISVLILFTFNGKLNERSKYLFEDISAGKGFCQMYTNSIEISWNNHRFLGIKTCYIISDQAKGSPSK